MPPIKTLDELSEALDGKVGQRFGALESKFDATSKRIDALEAAYQKAFTSQARKTPYVEGYEKSGDPERDFSLFRALKGHMLGWNYDGYDPSWPERELCSEAAKIHRAQSAGVDTEGGFVVPAQFMEEFIPLLEAESISLALGVQVMDGLAGAPVQIPKITGGATAYWTDENQSITESQVAFGQVNMVPHGLTALVRISNRLLGMTSGRAETIVRQDMARKIALEWDRAVMKGTNSSGEPLGMVNTPGISTQSFSTLAALTDYSGAAQLVTDLLEDLIGKLEDENALAGRLGFAMPPAGKRLLHKAKDADGKKLFDRSNPNLSGVPDMFYGYPYRTSTQLTGGAAADLIFARWDDVILGQWGTLVIDASSVAGTAFEKRQTIVRAFTDVDVAVRHAKSVATATSWDLTVS